MEGVRKIVMTADTVGGVWTYAVALCRELQQFGIEVHLATMGKMPTQGQYQQLEPLSNVVLHPGNFKLEWMEDSQSDIAAAQQWLKRLFAEIEPDLIHFNSYAQGSCKWDCPTVTVFHSCVQTWFHSVKREPAPEEWNWYKQLVRDALTTADTVIAPTQAILSEAEQIYGRLTHAKVIHNGIELSVNASEPEPFILTAGRLWDEAKNIGLLSELANQLSWPIYVAGAQSETGIINNMAVDNMKFLGELPPYELRKIMTKAAIYVSPAKYEPFGLSILEAANVGCALVLNDIPSLREIWGESAIYFDANNKSDATSSLDKLIQNSGLRIRMAEKAQEKSKQYSISRMAGNYLQMYTQLISEGKFKPTTAT